MLSPDFLAAVRSGERRALARAVTAVENELEGYEGLLDALFPLTGSAWRIGITGPPGAGKSTLVDGLIKRFRTNGDSVAVVAVDPTSPFTGGALLGDRIRMGRWADDPGVFIRSLATRGALGGLSLAAEATADVFDAAGFSRVILETVGVGQAEIDIAQAADTVCVVLVPDSGDAVQAMKAGLMEIADCFCINKSDHPDAARFTGALRSVLHLRPSSAPEPAVIKTVASRGEGLDALFEALCAEHEKLVTSGRRDTLRLDRFRRRVRRIAVRKLEAQFWNQMRMRRFEDTLARLDPGDRRPFALAESLLSMPLPE